MASTIQIKRGTGSAVPTGLSDGELAINLDNGKLFFGSGSTSVDNFTFGELTAEKYIVSSSVLYVTTSFSSGSTEFGDTADDTHTFTGAITASGNISASANIYALDYFDNGANINTLYAPIASPTFTGTVAIPNIANVSASIAANTTKVTNVSTNLTATTHASQITVNSSDGTNVIIAEASDTIAGVMSVAHHDKLDAIETSADVTDATNVLAAGALMDSELTDLAGVKGVTISTLMLSANTASFAVTSSNVLFGEITASGNISSSANVYAADYFDNGANISTIYSPIAGGTDIVTVGTITNGTWNAGIIAEAKLQNQSGTNTGDEDLASINALDITEVGTVSSGVWEGTVIASAKLDSDTAHLSGAQSFTGLKTFTAGIAPSFIKHTISGNNAGDYGPGAEILFGISSETTTAGAIYTLRSGVWTLIDANTDNRVDRLCAVAVGTNSSTNGMLIRGCVTLASVFTAGTDIEGVQVYASETGGQATIDAPSDSTDLVRILGYSLNVSSKKMFFNPDSTFLEIA